ncbi:hypothetical protein BKA82DRAFT_24368 [Pisolithus tinctorius]|uniref:KOW domain-containing protein n=1 Tax=Pisolithus tinctorius Marx 270 TaxID=870435 RepID=A0A0C3PEI7_PISTI|nr:hypothetical protein BKA82DRAFT_24368 [Pisolithus tinctorius]KIO06651.1 hypothetical protein M404DRAFT_24368 [Pisolithus tinctorius Marx 270]
MEPKVEITPALLNDKAFAFLERFVCNDVTDTSLLFNVEIELAVTGIAFKLEEWIDLIDIIILNLKGVGINAIKAAWELAQAKVVTVVPLLEDAAAWQLVLCWAADDSLSFANFLMEMEKFSDRYQFNEWKSIFDQVFKASREGTTVEVVRAAMAECGIIEPSSACDAPPALASSSCDVSHVVLSPQAPSSQTRESLRRSHRSLRPAKHPRMSKSTSQYLDISAWEDKEDKEDKEEDKLDDEANRCPRVTEIVPSGHANLTQQLESLFHCYGGEGSAEGSRAKAHQQGPVRSVEGHMEVGTNQTQPRVFKVVLPSVEEHFIEPRDMVCIISGPYRGLAGQVQYFSHSLRQIWVMWHTEKAFDDEDAKGDKGKSKAQVPEVPSKDSNSNGADNEEVIIVSLDNVQVTARPTLQFLKEKGWDISKGDLIQVIRGPAVDVKGVVCSIDLITTTLTLESEDGPWVHGSTLPVIPSLKAS